jgi:hypothetical protein
MPITNGTKNKKFFEEGKEVPVPRLHLEGAIEEGKERRLIPHPASPFSYTGRITIFVETLSPPMLYLVD